MPTLYKILGVKSTASPQELRTAFKRRALEVHPDKGGSKEAFQQVLLAFETLSSASGRLHYDQKNCPEYSKRRDDSLEKAQPEHHTAGKKCSGVKLPPSKLGMAGKSRHPENARSVQSTAAAHQCLRPKCPAPESVSMPPQKCFRVENAKPCVHIASKVQQVGKKPKWQAGFESKARSKSQESVRGNSGESLLGQIFGLLHLLPGISRRAVLRRNFTEAQRLKLETWIAEKRSTHQDVQRAPTTGRRAKQDSLEALSLEHMPLVLAEEFEESSTERHESSMESCSEDTVQDVYGADDPWDDCDPSDPRATLPMLSDLTEDCRDEAVEEEEHLETKVHTSQVRTLYRQDGRCNVYNASIIVNSLRIASRYVAELPTALDFMVVLNVVKQQILNSSGSFAGRVQRAISNISQEQQVALEDIGLKYHVEMPMMTWFGSRKKGSWATPHFDNLEIALQAWTEMEPFRWRKGLRIDFALDSWMQKVHSEWPKFREALLNVLEASGRQRSACAIRFDDMVRITEVHRMKHIELWNRKMMAKEESHQQFAQQAASQQEAVRERQESAQERWNRQAMAAEERQQRKATALEKSLEYRNRVALAAEDRHQRRILRIERRLRRLDQKALRKEDRLCRAWQRRADNTEQALVRRISNLLERWQSEQDRLLRRSMAEQRAREAEHMRQEVQRRKALIQETRRKNEERWKRMSRPDITMAELLGNHGN